jgi:hypothetical protein
VIDLFLLNALTIVTAFIGISLALDYQGLPRELGVVIINLVLAGGLVLWRIVQLAVSAG